MFYCQYSIEPWALSIPFAKLGPGRPLDACALQSPGEISAALIDTPVRGAYNAGGPPEAPFTFHRVAVRGLEVYEAN